MWVDICEMLPAVHSFKASSNVLANMSLTQMSASSSGNRCTTLMGMILSALFLKDLASIFSTEN